MKKKAIIFLLLVLVVSSYLYWINKYVQFYPVEFNTQEYVISQENFPPQFYINLEKVLNYYEEDFKEKNGVIYVKYKLFGNKELSYNYTKKANDSIWLSQPR